MGQRLDLDTLLKEALGSDNVYFQPPPGFMLSYPCIIYNRSDIHADHADNRPYKLENEYTVTVIDANPDSEIPMKLAQFPKSEFDRNFRSGNLNHDVFRILF